MAEHLFKVFVEYGIDADTTNKHVNTTTDGGGNFRVAYKAFGVTKANVEKEVQLPTPPSGIPSQLIGTSDDEDDDDDETADEREILARTENLDLDR